MLAHISIYLYSIFFHVFWCTSGSRQKYMYYIDINVYAFYVDTYIHTSSKCILI